MTDHRIGTRDESLDRAPLGRNEAGSASWRRRNAYDGATA